jgi:hypothetical protein
MNEEEPTGVKEEIDADDWPEPSDERIKEVVKLSIESMLRFLGIKPPSV